MSRFLEVNLVLPTLARGMHALPRADPPLTPPQLDSRDGLEEWIATEKTNRTRIDAIVREWISHRQWPPGLTLSDSRLIALRFDSAIRWVSLATHVRWPVPHTENALLRTVLIDAWPEAMEEWRLLLCKLVSEYQRGFQDGSSRAFGV